MDLFVCFFKQQTAYEMRISDWSLDVCSSDLARKLVCGDTDQIRGIGAGECEVAVANSYYFVRLMADPEEKALVDKVGWVFPNQDIGRASCRESVCQYV